MSSTSFYYFDPGGTPSLEDSATVYVDIQVTSVDLAELLDSATVYVDIQPSGVDVHGVPQNYIDADTVYVDIRARGFEDGVFHETFETLDPTLWDLTSYDPDSIDHAFYITRKHASEGPTSLLCNYDTIYTNIGGFYIKWIDTVYGDDNSKMYWLSYSFRLVDWQRVWGNGDRSGVIVLPSPAMDTAFNDYNVTAVLEATSATTGVIDIGYPLAGLSGYNAAITANAWHTIKIGIKYDKTTDLFDSEVWIDGTMVASETALDLSAQPFPCSPTGIDLAQTQSNTGGLVYIDDMTWQFDETPRNPSSTETGDGTTTEQWVKIRDKDGGLTGLLSIEFDDTDTGIPEAWIYASIYLSSGFLNSLANGESTNAIINSSRPTADTNRTLFLFLSKSSGVVRWRNDGDLAFSDPVTEGWYEMEIHYVEGAASFEVIINGVAYTVWCNTAHTNVLAAITEVVCQYPKGRDGSVPTTTTDAWYGVGNFAASLDGYVRNNNYDYWFPIQNQELADVIAYGGTPPIYPPYWAEAGPAGDVVSLEEGGEILPIPSPQLPEAVEDDNDVVYIRIEGSATEVFSVTSDAATILVDINMFTFDAFGYTDAATVYIDIRSLGGECHSTWSADFLGEGEAFVSMLGDPYAGLFGEAEADWSFGEVIAGDTVNC